MPSDASNKGLLREQPVSDWKLLLYFAIPTVLSLLSSALYSLADSFFVASLGANATAAVGVAFPIQAMLQAIGFTVGIGGAAQVSGLLGQGKQEQAQRVGFHALCLAVLLGGFVAFLGGIFSEPLVFLLGASEENHEYAQSYAVFLLLSALPMCVSLVLAQLLRAEGKVFAATLGLCIAYLLNVVLDPLLISVAGLGIRGASVATCISQTVGGSLLLYSFFNGKTFRFVRGGFAVARKDCVETIVLGTPSLFRQGLSALSATLLNHAARPYGSAAVTSMAVISKLFLLAYSFCLGVGQGMMPIVGFHYGGNCFLRVKRVYLKAVLLSSLAMLAISVPLFWFAPTWLSLFQPELDRALLWSDALRFQSAVLVLHGVTTCTILLYQMTRHPLVGTVLASARQGFFFLPLFLLLPQNLGADGVRMLQPFADIAAFAFTLPFLFDALRLLNGKEAQKTNR